MTDPFSVVSGCAGLMAVIGQTSLAMTKFVRGVRDARSDIHGVVKELSSMNMVLELIKVEAEERSLPEKVSKQFEDMVEECAGVVGDIHKLLDNYMARTKVDGNSGDGNGDPGGSGSTGEGGKLNKIGKRKAFKWESYGKEEVNSLRNRLEHYKNALDLFVDFICVTLNQQTQEDTREIKADMAEVKKSSGLIKADTGIILANTERLQSDSEVVRSNTELIRSDTQGIQSDTGVIRSDTGAIRTDVNTVLTEALGIKEEQAQLARNMRSETDRVIMLIKQQQRQAGYNSEGQEKRGMDPMDKVASFLEQMTVETEAAIEDDRISTDFSGTLVNSSQYPTTQFQHQFSVPIGSDPRFVSPFVRISGNGAIWNQMMPYGHQNLPPRFDEQYPFQPEHRSPYSSGKPAKDKLSEVYAGGGQAFLQIETEYGGRKEKNEGIVFDTIWDRKSRSPPGTRPPGPNEGPKPTVFKYALPPIPFPKIWSWVSWHPTMIDEYPTTERPSVMELRHEILIEGGEMPGPLRDLRVPMRNPEAEEWPLVVNTYLDRSRCAFALPPQHEGFEFESICYCAFADVGDIPGWIDFKTCRYEPRTNLFHNNDGARESVFVNPTRETQFLVNIDQEVQDDEFYMMETDYNRMHAATLENVITVVFGYLRAGLIDHWHNVTITIRISDERKVPDLMWFLVRIGAIREWASDEITVDDYKDPFEFNLPHRKLDMAPMGETPCWNFTPRKEAMIPRDWGRPETIGGRIYESTITRLPIWPHVERHGGGFIDYADLEFPLQLAVIISEKYEIGHAFADRLKPLYSRQLHFGEIMPGREVAGILKANHFASQRRDRERKIAEGRSLSRERRVNDPDVGFDDVWRGM